jgi:hypothetical protein
MQLPNVISLPDIVKNTADDLRKIRDAHAQDPVMQFTECEVELTVVASADVEGKIKLFVVVETGAKVSYENTQKVKLKFTTIPGQPGIQAPAVPEGTAPLPKRK